MHGAFTPMQLRIQLQLLVAELAIDEERNPGSVTVSEPLINRLMNLTRDAQAMHVDRQPEPRVKMKVKKMRKR